MPIVLTTQVSSEVLKGELILAGKQQESKAKAHDNPSILAHSLNALRFIGSHSSASPSIDPMMIKKMITRATIFLMATLPIAVHALSLNITAITANGAGSSIFECWSLDAPLVTSTQPGLVGAASSFLGDVANMTYSVTPVSFHNENHNAPYNQQAPLVHSIGNSALIYLSRWVIPIAGIGIVTLPDDPATDLYITKDIPSGIFFAADTADISHVGHGNLFPGYTSVIIMQIPTLGNKVPKHTVLHAGYCTSNDTIGLSTLG